MLLLLNSVKCIRLPYRLSPKILHEQLRFYSDKSKKPGDKDQKTGSPCKKAAEPKKAEECKKPAEPKKKEECKKPAPVQKDITSIAGGPVTCTSKKPKPPCPPIDKTKKVKQLTCQELIMEREGLNKTKNAKLSKIAGGGSKCPVCPIGKAKGQGKNIWGKITLFGILPMIAVLTLLVFGSHHEHKHPEYVYYPHMYRRQKPFYFKDGNTSMFHNSEMNALPPDGYEDEIDVEANGKTPESDEERKQREKEFGVVYGDWKKMNSKREADAKKEQEAAEKEAEKAAKKAQVEAEKEDIRLRKEAENEPKEANKVQKTSYFPSLFGGSSTDEE